MEGLSDRVIAHLRQVLDSPDLTGTKYYMIEQIGRGGMGAVYLVRDRELERNVALKVLASTGAEARVLAYLEHPGIVPVHDAGTLVDGRCYYVMKFVQGKRLDQYAQTRPPLSDLLRVFTRICEPVAFAHAQGVIHCDLKPANIMTGNFGEVLVLDWGVAKFVNSEHAAECGTVIGTRDFMAPEQAAGDSDQIDGRSDIYALGKILSDLLKVSQAGPIPRPLRAIADRAAAEVQTQRYDTPLDLAADIERFLAGQPVTAYRENLLERSTRLVAGNRTLVALMATYVLMRILIVVVFRR